MIFFNPIILRRKKHKRYSSPHPAMPSKIYKDSELNDKLPRFTVAALMFFILFSLAGLAALFFRLNH